MLIRFTRTRRISLGLRALGIAVHRSGLSEGFATFRDSVSSKFVVVVDHLNWRRRVGEGVAMAYDESSKVAATALGGSVARGWADEFSDVEVFVFWNEAPTSAERTSAVHRSGGSVDVSWLDTEAEERCG